MLKVLDHLGGNVLQDKNRITLPELDAKLKHLNTKKAKGHDILPSLTPILHSLYNILVYRGHYPMVWKRAMGLMILKPNKKKSDPGSFYLLNKANSEKRGRLTTDSFNLHRSLRNNLLDAELNM